MGVVYLAEDVDLKRQVALKFLAHQAGQDPRRLIREAQITSGLYYPNIATVYEIGGVGVRALYRTGCTARARRFSRNWREGPFPLPTSSRFCVRSLTAWRTPTRWASFIAT